MSVYNKKEYDAAVKRIEEMEESFSRASAAVSELKKALDNYADIRKDIAKLKEYYENSDWKCDFQADEAGEFTPSLKRGVLSEDGIWNLLEENDELLLEMKKL